MPRLRTALICHAEDSLDAGVLPAWLGTFSEFAGCVVIAERRSTLWRRVRNEWRRSGWLGFLDVIAFKIYFRLVCAAGAGRRLDELQRRLRERYPGGAGAAPSLLCHSPNTEEARAFLQSLRPDIVIARCKFILKEEVYSIPTRGTFVLHPGVCPEYRNAHGCFWALAAGDRERVGATLLQVDRGVDTGPVYGHGPAPHDALVADCGAFAAGRAAGFPPGDPDARGLRQPRGHPGQAAGNRRWQRGADRHQRAPFGGLGAAAPVGLSALEGAGASMSGRIAALIYHDVTAPGADGSSGFAGADAAHYKLDIADFELHLENLARLVATHPLLTADELLNAVPLERPLALTFDDGGCTALSEIAPRLEARGWRGSFFITAGRVDTPGFLRAADVRALSDRGHAIGSHSMTHATPFSALTPAAMHAEWRESCRLLGDIIGKEVVTASVPGGYYSRQVRDAALEAGIRLLFTSEPTSRAVRHRQLLVCGRYSVTRATSAQQAAALAGGAAAATGRQWLSWNLKKVLKKAGGNSWLKLRKALFERRARSQ